MVALKCWNGLAMRACLPRLRGSMSAPRMAADFVVKSVHEAALESLW